MQRLWILIVLGLVLPLVGQASSLQIVETEGMPGQTISVPVTITDASGIASMKAQVNYDPLFLEAQGVTNNGVGDPVYVGYAAEQGAFDLFLGTDSSLPSGARTMAYMQFQINPGAKPGDFVPLVVADHDLGGEYGESVAWSSETSSTDAGVWVVFSSEIDSDGDGLSDYDEQMLNGSADYDTAGGDADVNNPDSDGDGMLDGWEVNNGLNPLANDAALDDDGDGLTNYEEWIAGSSPGDRSDAFAITGAEAGTNAMEAVFHWSSLSGRLYSVYSHTNLSTTWPVAPAYQILGDGTQQSYTNTSSESPRYFRIGVELAP